MTENSLTRKDQLLKYLDKFFLHIEENINVKNMEIYGSPIKKFSDMPEDKRNIFKNLVISQLENHLINIRNDLIEESKIEIRNDFFEYFIKERKNDKYKHLYLATLQHLIQPLGLFMNNKELLMDPMKWVDENFDEDNLQKIGRYMDLFYELIYD